MKNRKRSKNLWACTQNLHFEIKGWYTTFQKKCSVSVDDVDDYEVLDLKTQQMDFQLEFRDLIDKISSFVTFLLLFTVLWS